MEFAGKVKPTQIVEAVGDKVLPKSAGMGLKAATTALDLGDEVTSSDSMMTTLAGRLDVDAGTLMAQSQLISDAKEYNEGAVERGVVEVGSDIALGMTPMGAGLIAKTALGMAAEKELNPGEKLAVVYDFVSSDKPVTRKDIVTVIAAKASEDDRISLKNYPVDGTGASDILETYVSDLIGPDFRRGEQNVAEYLADKFNNGEIEKATMVLNKPVNRPPLETLQSDVDQTIVDGPALDGTVSADVTNYAMASDGGVTPPRTPNLRGSKGLAV